MTSSEAKANILIVDDTAANVALLSTMLSERGYKIRPAVNGNLAIQAAKKSAPDLILLDIRMPDMDGYEVCRILKDDAATMNIPIIFISALDEVVDKVKAFQVGGVDYITKPFQFEEVLARVENQLMLMRQRQKIEDLSAQKDQVMRMVSHDLKNPLGVVMGYTEMLKNPEYAIHTEKVVEVSGRIEESAHKMLRLVTSFLNLALIEDGIVLKKEVLSLGTFLNTLCSGFTMLAKEKGITFKIEEIPGALNILADQARLEQVLTNLISNAIKYTPEGGTVTVKGYVKDKNTVIDIIDTGLGIPPDALSHLFEKFYRVDTTEHKKQEGSGLGLAIADMLTEAHGGEILVESEIGKGTTFSVVLPPG